MGDLFINYSCIGRLLVLLHSNSCIYRWFSSDYKQNTLNQRRFNKDNTLWNSDSIQSIFSPAKTDRVICDKSMSALPPVFSLENPMDDEHWCCSRCPRSGSLTGGQWLNDFTFNFMFLCLRIPWCGFMCRCKSPYFAVAANRNRLAVFI